MSNLKEKYPYFYELVIINNSLFDYVIDLNIRDEQILKPIEFKLKKLNSEQTLNEELLLDTLSSILCLQPFCDGNSRTLKIYLKNYLNKFNKSLDINGKVIPIYYTSNDYLSQNDIDNFRKRVS